MAKYYIGYVEDIFDPNSWGRVKVRIPELHGDIPLKQLFWSQVMMPVTSSSGGKGVDHELLEGDQIIGFFMDEEDRQNFLITGTIRGVPRNRNNDPQRRYPEIVNEPDTNRLTRAQKVNLTSIGEINNNRISFDNINGTKWQEESSKYNARYPYNKVYESLSGHIVEYDSTPDNTRYHQRFPSKNYIESDHNGNTATKTYGVWRQYTLKDSIYYTRGNRVETVDGDYLLRVKGSFVLEVDGHQTIWIKGDKDERIDGRFREFVKKTKETVVKLQHWIWSFHLHLNDWKQERPKPKSGK